MLGPMTIKEAIDFDFTLLTAEDIDQFLGMLDEAKETIQDKMNLNPQDKKLEKDCYQYLEIIDKKIKTIERYELDNDLLR